MKGNIKDKLENYTDIFPNTTKYYGENTSTFAAELSIEFEEEELKKDMNICWSWWFQGCKWSLGETSRGSVQVKSASVQTEPDDFEDEDLKALEDEDEGQRINAFDAVKVKIKSED